MTTSLNILAPTRYPWQFNGPRNSRHKVSVRSFLPLNKISSNIEGITIYNPLPLQRFDLVHAFNRIPVGRTPFIIGFESHLPRAFGCENTSLYRLMTSALVDKRCRAIIAISDYARRQFLRQHEHHPDYGTLAAKLSVRYPNFPIPSEPNLLELKAGEPVRLLFVGNHFGRKGGSVAIRLAERALREKFPLHVDIVSSLEMGDTSWVSPTRSGYWEHDLKWMKSLGNIRHYQHLPNNEVLALVQQAHFVLLPTFSDSFGYSAIEAMANSTPVIATKQCSLPEFINNENGILLDLETDKYGEWKYIEHPNRASKEYEDLFDREVERLVHEAYSRLQGYISNPAAYASLRQQAWQTAQKLFSETAASEFWDDFYENVIKI